MSSRRIVETSQTTSLYVLSDVSITYLMLSFRMVTSLKISSIALRKAKIVYNFGLSECSRVKKGNLNIIKIMH